jgi:hypothetical protein
MKPLLKLFRVCTGVALGVCMLSAVARDVSSGSTACNDTLLVQAAALNASIERESANAIKGNSTAAFVALRAQRKELLAVVTSLQAAPKDARITPLLVKLESLERNLSTLIEQETALQQLAQTIMYMRAMQSQLTDLPEEIVELTAQHNGLPRAVMAATQLLYVNQRLMHSLDTLYANDHIEPEVPFFIGKDSSSIQTLTQGLLHGSKALGLAAPHPQTRAKIKQWVAAYSALETHLASTRKGLQQVLAAKRS